MRPMGEADGSVQMLWHHDVASGQRPSPVHSFNLRLKVLETDGVVTVHRARKLLSSGHYQLVVRAWDSTGYYFSSQESFTVTSGPE